MMKRCRWPGACKGLFSSVQDDVKDRPNAFRDSALVALLDSVTDIVLEVNGQRQIVFVNHNLLDLLQLDDAATLMGCARRIVQVRACVRAKSAVAEQAKPAPTVVHCGPFCTRWVALSRCRNAA